MVVRKLVVVSKEWIQEAVWWQKYVYAVLQRWGNFDSSHGWAHQSDLLYQREGGYGSCSPIRGRAKGWRLPSCIALALRLPRHLLATRNGWLRLAMSSCCAIRVCGVLQNRIELLN